MNEVIEDFIKIEQEIKQVYLGEKIRSSPAILTDRTMKKSEGSEKNRNKIGYDIKKILLNEELEEEFDEEEENLRKIMTDKFKKEEKKLPSILTTFNKLFPLFYFLCQFLNNIFNRLF